MSHAPDRSEGSGLGLKNSGDGVSLSQVKDNCERLEPLVRSGGIFRDWDPDYSRRPAMRAHDRERMLRVKEAAELLGVSPNTVRAWGAAGKIPEYGHPANGYPAALRRYLSDSAPAAIWAYGNTQLLERGGWLGLFCSVKCPGNLILRTYDFACSLRDEGAATISGFHSPTE